MGRISSLQVGMGRSSILGPSSFFKTRTSSRFSTLKPNSIGNNNDKKRASDSEEEEEEEWVSLPSASPYQVLGLDPSSSSCSRAQIKAAFRARVKEFHPDVCKDTRGADAIIQRVIHAYEILSKDTKHQPTEDTNRENVDPFDEPECEAYDLFVNELLCVGKGCPYSCVSRAPHAFSFTSENGTARTISQGHSDDYLVHLAVGQCPRRCIHYVTPSQRAVLEDLLYNVLNDPYNEGDAAFLESLISKATLENNRYVGPKRQPKASTEYVDWC